MLCLPWGDFILTTKPTTLTSADASNLLHYCSWKLRQSCSLHMRLWTSVLSIRVQPVSHLGCGGKEEGRCRQTDVSLCVCGCVSLSLSRLLPKGPHQECLGCGWQAGAGRSLHLFPPSHRLGEPKPPSLFALRM